MKRYIKHGFLQHSGVKGQKHGVRQYQYPDGSLTPLGRIHYGVGPPRQKKAAAKGAVGDIKVRYRMHQINREMKRNIANNKVVGKKIQGEHSVEEDLAAINPNFWTSNDPTYWNNCPMCATAYELRRRGYDVVANPTALGRYTEDVVKNYYKVSPDHPATYAMAETYKGFTTIFQQLPNGSHGILSLGVNEYYDLHHMMNWESLILDK